MVSIGITVQPERRYLDLVFPIAAELADYVEVAPETLWRRGEDGDLEPNGYHREIAGFVAATGLGIVAHGTGLSLGTADPDDVPRMEHWLRRIAADLESLPYAWYSDHIGATTLAGQNVALPMPLPFLEETAGLVRRRLRALQRVIPDVGFENAVHEFLLGDWLDEPAWIHRALGLPRTWLVLDLHNLFTVATNRRVDPRAWLERLQPERVIELHVSGGRPSPAGWLPEGRTRRLDSHDDAVPEPVWELLAEVAEHCPNLRGVTVERMEGTVDEEAAELLASELLRARGIAGG